MHNSDDIVRELVEGIDLNKKHIGEDNVLDLDVVA